MRDRAGEELFHAIYGSPLLAGTGRDSRPAMPVHGDIPARTLSTWRPSPDHIADFKARIAEGGPREAAIRALLYIRLAEGAADERGLALLRRIRDEHGGGLTLGEFKQLVREQFFMLLLDEERALGAIPSMLASDRDGAARAARDLQRMTEVVGLKTKAAKARLAEVEAIFAAAGNAPSSGVTRLGDAVSRVCRPARRRAPAKRRRRQPDVFVDGPRQATNPRSLRRVGTRNTIG